MAFTLSSDLPPELYPLSYLPGTWRGEGTVGYPGVEEAKISQRIDFTVGQGVALAYNCETHLLDRAGQPGQLWHQESGYWRVTPGQDQKDPPFDLEVVVADAAGVLSLYLGQVNGPRIELATDAMVRSASAPEMAAGRRMYGLVEGDLLWAWDLAAFGHPLGSYLACSLKKVGV